MHSTALQHFMVSEFFWKSPFLDAIFVWKSLKKDIKTYWKNPNESLVILSIAVG